MFLKTIICNVKFLYRVHIKWLPKLNAVLENILLPLVQSIFYISAANFINDKNGIIYYITGSLCFASIGNVVEGNATLISAERRFGTLNYSITSTINSSVVFFSKFIYWCIIGYISFFVNFIAISLIFDRTIININNFIGFSFIYILICIAHSAIGYIIGIVAIVKRNVVALSTVTSMFILMFSGIYFSVDLMPKYIAYLSYIIPMKYGVDSLRIFVDNGFNFQCLSNLLMMLFLGAVYFLIGVMIHKKLEKNMILNSKLDIF